MTLHDDPRRFLLHLFDAAVRAVQPAARLAPHLPPPPKGRLVILAAGKAAASMAAAAENFYDTRWPGTKIEGIAVTRYGHTCPTQHVKIREAGHPFPDATGTQASTDFLALAGPLGQDDLALVLLSGGASALLTLPLPGISIDEKQALTRQLLASGAPIAEVNCVRSHLSRLKGGRLAQAIYPAPMLTLAISDVASNDPTIIGSGPTVPTTTTPADAMQVIDRYGVSTTDNLIQHLKTATPSPPKTDRCFEAHRFVIVASGSHALAAAATLAREAGCEVTIVGDQLEDDATTLAASHARMACSHTNPGATRLILSGGEATVSLGEKYGAGGPNQEFALALALQLDGNKLIHALACDTDGIDGGSGSASDPAGAIISPRTLERAATLELDPEMALKNHDTGAFFAHLDDLVTTGPTRTNVNDFRAILISA